MNMKYDSGYAKNLNEWRKRAYANSARRCVLCGFLDAKAFDSSNHSELHCHHPLTRADHPNKQHWVMNCILLCPRCHRLAHTLLRANKSEYSALMLKLVKKNMNDFKEFNAPVDESSIRLLLAALAARKEVK